MHGRLDGRDLRKGGSDDRLAAETLNGIAFDGLHLLGHELGALRQRLAGNGLGSVAHVYTRSNHQEGNSQPKYGSQQKHHGPMLSNELPPFFILDAIPSLLRAFGRNR